MASINLAPAFVVIALLLFAASNPLSHAQLGSLSGLVPGVVNTVIPIVNGLNGMFVSGLLCCTPNGNCQAGATGLAAGIPITIKCTNLLGGTVTVGQGTVGANGGFNVSVVNLLSTTGGLVNPNLPIPCFAVLPLPLNQTAVCPTLTAVTGVLNGAVSTVQSVTSTADGLIGSVGVFNFVLNGTINLGFK